MKRKKDSQGNTWMMVALAAVLVGLTWWGIARHRATT